jgi:hypothetical protein
MAWVPDDVMDPEFHLPDTGDRLFQTVENGADLKRYRDKFIEDR